MHFRREINKTISICVCLTIKRGRGRGGGGLLHIYLSLIREIANIQHGYNL